MRTYLSQRGVFWVVAGLLTVLVGLASATPADARRMTQRYQTATYDGDAASGAQNRRSASKHQGHARRAAVRGYARSNKFTRGRSRYVQRQGRRAQVALVANRRAASQASAGWMQDGGDQRYATDRRYASSGSSNSIVAEARRWLGTNPTHRRTLWCAAFMNFVLERTGHRGTGSDLARSFASAGHRVSGPQVGAIAVMSRRGGGHVGVVSGVDSKGNPIIISGNHRRTVAEAVYPRGRVYAYVLPR
jgi:uncharacterized protein (TIGR02594 family)